MRRRRRGARVTIRCQQRRGPRTSKSAVLTFPDFGRASTMLAPAWGRGGTRGGAAARPLPGRSWSRACPGLPVCPRQPQLGTPGAPGTGFPHIAAVLQATSRCSSLYLSIYLSLVTRFLSSRTLSVKTAVYVNTMPHWSLPCYLSPALALVVRCWPGLEQSRFRYAVVNAMSLAISYWVSMF